MTDRAHRILQIIPAVPGWVVQWRQDWTWEENVYPKDFDPVADAGLAKHHVVMQEPVVCFALRETAEGFQFLDAMMWDSDEGNRLFHDHTDFYHDVIFDPANRIGPIREECWCSACNPGDVWAAAMDEAGKG